MTLRVAMLSHAMLNMFSGGLGIRVQSTMEALRARGIDCSLINPYTDRLSNYDLVHVFSGLHATHLIVAAAKSDGLPVVLSPVLYPNWTKWQARVADFCDRLVGRLTRWEVRTTFRQIQSGVRTADRVIALGEAEKRMLIECYGANPEAIRVIPNGVSRSFLEAKAEAFRERYRIFRKFALCVGYIGEIKNQLALIESLRDEDIDIVLVGACDGINQSYLERCRAAGGDRLHYVGFVEHDDPLLASAFAAAEIFVLPSQCEVAPNAAIEALAVGKPIVLTKHHSLDIEPDDAAFVEVDPYDVGAIRDAVRRLLAEPPDPEKCTALVEDYTLDRVVSDTIAVYDECLDERK